MGTLIGPEGKKTEISFSPTTRGRYAARVEPVIPGPHTLQLSVDGASLPKIGLYLSGDKFGEQMGKGFNFSLLEKLATQTGGIVNPTVEVLRTGSVFQEKSRDHTPLVLALAFLLLLLEISARERKS